MFGLFEELVAHAVRAFGQRVVPLVILLEIQVDGKIVSEREKSSEMP